MDPDRWQDLKELFDAVRELPPEKRSQLLDRRCAEDPELRSEVEALVRAQDLDDGFLEPPIATESPRTGDVLGAYRIERRIGSGGMSDVYLAARADGAFEQRVAVKVLRRGAQDEERRRRFHLERQLLARLEHPGIARILDGGTTSDGRPYLILEYVEGQPLDTYCRGGELSLRGRLELFLQICEAVGFAHRSLIVHQDIKPSNILVSDRGEPKLLDFGIAAWVADEAATTPAQLSSHSSGFLTPEYASPEQVRGEPLTTATDVYSLGVVLFELLTDRRPYRFQQPTTRSEIERVICEVAPPPPSEATDRDRPFASRALRGDLDAIVDRALQKSPADRYTSVDRLAEDLRRHLTGFPVQARRGTIPYRLGKLLVRHRATSAAMALALLALLAGTLTTAWQARNAARERDEARARLVETERLTAFLIDLLGLADPAESRGEQLLNARQLLDRGTEQIARLDGQPLPQARLMHTMGTVYVRLALFDEARSVLERALAVRRRALGPDHPEVADSLDALSHLEVQLGRHEPAEKASREALRLREIAQGAKHPAVARTLSNLALALEGQGRYDEAEGTLRQALAIREAATARPEDVGMTLNNLGGILYRQGRLEEAETTFRQALEIAREVHESPHPDVALRLNNLALVHHARGELAEARELYQQSLEQSRQLYGESHPAIAQRYNNLGGLALQEGDPEAAEDGFRRALEIYRQIHAGEHPVVATATSNLAMALQVQERVDEAEELYREAIEMQERLLAKEHPEVAVTAARLGQMLLEADRLEEAEPWIRQAVAIYTESLGEDHWQLADSQVLLGRLLLARGELADAELLLEEALEVLEPRFGVRAPVVHEAIRALASLHEQRDEPERARDYRQMLER